MKTLLTSLFILVSLFATSQRDIYSKWGKDVDTITVQTCCCYKSYVVNIASDLDGNLTIVELRNDTGHIIEWFYDSIGNWYATGFTEEYGKVAMFIGPDVNTGEKMTGYYYNQTISISYVNIGAYYDCIPSNVFGYRTIEIRIYQ